MTVAAGIETARVIANQDNQTVFPSRDGRHYVALKVQGDIAADGIWLEVLSGRLDRDLDGATPHVVARLFTRGLGYPHGIGQIAGSSSLTTSMNVPRWLNDSRVAFLWEDQQGVIQVVALDVLSGDLEFLTHETEDVINFAGSPVGGLVYDVRATRSKAESERLLANGFSVKSRDALSLLAGNVDGSSIYDAALCDRYVLPPSSGRTKVSTQSIICQLSFVATMANVTNDRMFTRDGTQVLLNVPVTSAPPEWNRFTNHDVLNSLRQLVTDKTQLEARWFAELGILSMTGSYRSLQVPVNRLARLRVSWSPDGKSILLWPAFVPPATADAVGLDGQAVAAVDVSTGTIAQLPVPPDVLGRLKDIDLPAADRAEIVLKDGSSIGYMKRRGAWRASPPSAKRAQSPSGATVPREGVRVEVREDSEVPPALYAVNRRDGRERQLLKLNPQLGDGIALAKVETVRWNDAENRQWTGRLYYPLHYRAGERYPLVVQLGAPPRDSQFSIYGPDPVYESPATGPGFAVYLAQAIASREIAVLQTQGPDGGYGGGSQLQRMKNVSAGLTVAVERLIARGMIRQDAVGLMGHSKNGRVVEYALTHSDFGYAAAIVSDAADGNYLQAALVGWPSYGEDMNGAAPFGKGMEEWVLNSPAFNVERVQTPLQLMVTSSSDGFAVILAMGWEMFSRLRHVGKPVELYVVPDIRHGSHFLQNPRQLNAIQTRALDWWCFWLKDEERQDEAAAEQYADWRRLRELHKQALTQR
jgi:hypothetical protein